jgi:acyl-CoA synthetase (AMP-forming)/AMP-acid ligase II
MRFAVLGLETVLMDGWHAPSAARLIESEGVTVTSGTPFHLAGLLDAADAEGMAMSQLKEYSLGGTTVPPSLISRCDERGVNAFRSYGLSEHPTISTGCSSDSLEDRLGSDGQLNDGVEVRIVDESGKDLPCGMEGEILSRGPELFVGYRRESRDTEIVEDGGWLRTGDIGRLDARGYLTITDRKKDLIIRGGENLSSREIEDHLVTHPAILDAAVVGLPDPRLGERVAAFVILRTDTALTIEDLGHFFISKGVARQKTPERLMFVTELPRTAAGKVLKQELRKLLKIRVGAN